MDVRLYVIFRYLPAYFPAITQWLTGAAIGIGHVVEQNKRETI